MYNADCMMFNCKRMRVFTDSCGIGHGGSYRISSLLVIFLHIPIGLCRHYEGRMRFSCKITNLTDSGVVVMGV